MEATLTTLDANYEESRKFPRGASSVGSCTQCDVKDWCIETPPMAWSTKRQHFLSLAREAQPYEGVTLATEMLGSISNFDLMGAIHLEPEQSPFNSLFISEHGALDRAIRRILIDLHVSFSRGIFERVRELIGYGYEDEPDQVPISPESVENLIVFFQQYPHASRPNIVVTPSRNIQMQWGKQPDRKLVIELLPNYNARFVVFSRDIDRPEKINRMSGRVSTKHVIDAVKSFGVLSWITAQRHG